MIDFLSNKTNLEGSGNIRKRFFNSTQQNLEPTLYH